MSQSGRSEAVIKSICLRKSLVYLAANLPRLAKQAGSCVIQVNAEPTDLDQIADFNLHCKAGELLPLLLQTAFSINQ